MNDFQRRISGRCAEQQHTQTMHFNPLLAMSGQRPSCCCAEPPR
jgi:hypothetical protein